MRDSTHLESNAVFYNQSLGEKPCACRGTAHVATVWINRVQGSAAVQVFPDFGERHAATSRRAVLRLEVQPRQRQGVSRYGGRAGVALWFADGGVG